EARRPKAPREREALRDEVELIGGLEIGATGLEDLERDARGPARSTSERHLFLALRAEAHLDQAVTAVARRQPQVRERRGCEALPCQSCELVIRTEEPGPVSTGAIPSREARSEDELGELRLELEAELAAQVPAALAQTRAAADEGCELP